MCRDRQRRGDHRSELSWQAGACACRRFPAARPRASAEICMLLPADYSRSIALRPLIIADHRRSWGWDWTRGAYQNFGQQPPQVIRPHHFRDSDSCPIRSTQSDVGGPGGLGHRGRLNAVFCAEPSWLSPTPALPEVRQHLPVQLAQARGLAEGARSGDVDAPYPCGCAPTAIARRWCRRKATNTPGEVGIPENRSQPTNVGARPSRPEERRSPQEHGVGAALFLQLGQFADHHTEWGQHLVL